MNEISLPAAEYIKEPKPVVPSANALARVLNTRRCPKCKTTTAVSAVYSNSKGKAVVKIEYTCGCVSMAAIKKVKVKA